MWKSKRPLGSKAFGWEKIWPRVLQVTAFGSPTRICRAWQGKLGPTLILQKSLFSITTSGRSVKANASWNSRLMFFAWSQSIVLQQIRFPIYIFLRKPWVISWKPQVIWIFPYRMRRTLTSSAVVWIFYDAWSNVGTLRIDSVEDGTCMRRNPTIPSSPTEVTGTWRVCLSRLLHIHLKITC